MKCSAELNTNFDHRDRIMLAFRATAWQVCPHYNYVRYLSIMIGINPAYDKVYDLSQLDYYNSSSHYLFRMIYIHLPRSIVRNYILRRERRDGKWDPGRQPVERALLELHCEPERQ